MPCCVTLSTALRPSGLFGLLFFVKSATDVTLPLGREYRKVHRHIAGVVFAHICANLSTEPLHGAALHVALCVDIPTAETKPPKASVKLILCFTILLGGYVEQSVMVA